eukprot:2182155-Rhodomonas_salina.1
MSGADPGRVRYAPSVCCYAVCGTDLANGTELAYGSTPCAVLTYMTTCFAMSGTMTGNCFRMRPSGTRTHTSTFRRSLAAICGCDAAIEGSDTAIYGCDAAIYGCDAAIYGCDTAIYGCDAAIYGCDDAIYGCDAAIHGENFGYLRA